MKDEEWNLPATKLFFIIVVNIDFFFLSRFSHFFFFFIYLLLLLRFPYSSLLFVEVNASTKKQLHLERLL